MNPKKKVYFTKLLLKIYVEKNSLYELFNAGAPCCHNTLEPGLETAGDPLDEAGGHGGPGIVDVILQLLHVGVFQIRMVRIWSGLQSYLEKTNG